MPRRFYVTTPIYYVNDVPHLGTAYTTVAADVLSRYHRLRGADVHFLTGTDEHGVRIERIAAAEGIAPAAFADRMAAPFREAWPKLGCAFDDFIRTTEPRHEEKVQDLWRRVARGGDHLYRGTYEGWYCVGCEAYYTEKDLEPGAVCPLHKQPVERVQEPSWFFRLSAFGDRLLALYDRRPEFVQPATRRNEVRSFVAGGLDDLSVSRKSFRWGVPVPDDPDHVMYVWFDALANYWTAVQAPGKERFWPASVHLVGKDILRFHAVYWPAFLMAAGFGDDDLPRQVFAHGFLTIGGQKMSKSLRNTVSPVALAETLGADALRYYLMRAVAFGQDGDFDVRDLVVRYNAELGNGLGNLAQRVLALCHRHFAGRVPPAGEEGDLERELHAAWAGAAAEAAAAFGAVQPHRALDAIWRLVAEANRYVDRAAPWAAAKKGDTARLGTILMAGAGAIEALSRMAWPVLPESADALRAQLGVGPVRPQTERDQWPGVPSRVPEGTPLGEARPVFPRVDAKREAEIVARFSGRAADATASPSPSPSPSPTSTPAATATIGREGGRAAASGSETPGGLGADAGAGGPTTTGSPATVPFDAFAKLDLRVGVVVAAERVPGKDKLLSLRVDVGDPEPRPLVAGIALSFEPASLVGRRIVVVCNLEPRKFGKGLESRGMLLAAGPSEALALVTVAGDAAPGTRVK